MCLSTFHDLQTLLNMAFACFSNQFYSTFSHSGLFSGPGIHWPLWICMVSFHSLKYTPPPHTYTHTHTEDPSNSYLSFRFQNFPDLQTSYIPPQYPVLPWNYQKPSRQILSRNYMPRSNMPDNTVNVQYAFDNIHQELTCQILF